LPVIELDLEGDLAFKDLVGRYSDVIHLSNDAVIKIAALGGGMKSGLPSLAIRLDLPDGKVVIAETSLALFLSTADLLRAWSEGLERDAAEN
jgi:uncharacterized membrane protein